MNPMYLVIGIYLVFILLVCLVAYIEERAIDKSYEASRLYINSWFTKKDTTNGEMVKRDSKKQGTGWRITIDDGYCAYRYSLDASEAYCIDSLFNHIQSSIIKRGKKPCTK